MEFKRSRAYKKIAKGGVGWHCEWCGEEVIFAKDDDPEDMLEKVRNHSLRCEENRLRVLVDAIKDDVTKTMFSSNPHDYIESNERIRGLLEEK